MVFYRTKCKGLSKRLLIWWSRKCYFHGKVVQSFYCRLYENSHSLVERIKSTNFGLSNFSQIGDLLLVSLIVFLYVNVFWSSHQYKKCYKAWTNRQTLSFQLLVLIMAEWFNYGFGQDLTFSCLYNWSTMYIIEAFEIQPVIYFLHCGRKYKHYTFHSLKF